jgi:hypothetical protein
MPSAASNRSRIIALIGEILTVLGPIAVLGLWLYQQVEVERRSDELRALSAARTVYQTYQSHNALFNAVSQLVGSNKESADSVRVFQIYNYELGLRAIERVLSAAEKAGIPPAVDVYGGTQSAETKMTQTQQRLEALQTRLDDKEAAIKRLADQAHATYLWVYVMISLVTIGGAALKVWDRLAGTP